MTERKSSGICEAPRSAAEVSAVVMAPSEATVSSAERRGDERLGLSTCLRMKGVFGTCEGASIFCGAGAAGAGAMIVMYMHGQKGRA